LAARDDRVWTEDEVRAEYAHYVRAPLPGEPAKRCSTCKETLTMDSYHARRRTPDGKKRTCKLCIKAYHMTHREQRRASNKRTKDKTSGRKLGVSRSEASVVLDAYRESGEVLPIIDERLEAELERFRKGDD